MDPSTLPAAETPRLETEQDYWTPEEHRADRERRIAWRVAATLLFLTAIASLIFSFVSREEGPMLVTLVRAPLTLLLAVFLWLDRKWARNVVLMLLILGSVVLLAQLQTISWSTVVFVAMVLALVLMLAGRPKRWRTIAGAAFYSLILVVGVGSALVSILLLNTMSLSPKDADKLVEANQALDAGDYDEARNLFLKIVETSPDSAVAHFGLCEAYMQRRSFALALKSCEKAIELNPRFVDAHSYRTALLLQLKRYEGAEKAATETLAIEERFSAYAMRAEARMRRGDTAGARADTEKALELATTDEQRAGVQSLLEKLP